ncbi:MAG: hypothetical protein GF315_08420 [candidate division Zixibacteria bacterium]|nr:hypothetical protein [candidate division Zixibacteria bacterium]
MQAWYIWIIVGIILSILEIFTSGFLVINLGIGAIIAGLVALTGAGIKAQIIVFALSSLVVFVFIRKFAVRYLNKQKPDSYTNVEALKGKTGIVTAPIGGSVKKGQVKVGGEEWSALCQDDVEVEVGERIVVTAIDGNKLIVRKEE